MRTLHYTEDILPKSISQTMITDLLEYDFGDGISVAVMTNSPRVLESEVLEAYKKWHQ